MNPGDLVTVDGRRARIIAVHRHGVYSLRVIGESALIERVGSELTKTEEMIFTSADPVSWDSPIIVCGG